MHTYPTKSRFFHDKKLVQKYTKFVSHGIKCPPQSLIWWVPNTFGKRVFLLNIKIEKKTIPSTIFSFTGKCFVLPAWLYVTWTSLYEIFAQKTKKI